LVRGCFDFRILGSKTVDGSQKSCAHCLFFSFFQNNTKLKSDTFGTDDTRRAVLGLLPRDLWMRTEPTKKQTMPVSGTPQYRTSPPQKAEGCPIATLPTVGGIGCAPSVRPTGETPRVIARLPSVSNKSIAEPVPPAVPMGAGGDGRLISAQLSMKLLVGGAILLVLAAVLPTSIGRSRRANFPDDQLPGWHAETLTPNPAEKPAPQTTGQRPAQDSVAPSQGHSRPSPKKRPAKDTPPAAPGTTTPNAAANRAMRIEEPAATTAGTWPTAAKWSGKDRGAEVEVPHRRPPPSLAEREMALPHETISKASRPTAEPGVAWLEGIIEQPSYRTTHERIGSSIY
jgi:hypothetical protein